MLGKRKRNAAAQEAFEEAGVRGKIGHGPIGSFTYFKRRPKQLELIWVKVYPLRVDIELDRWPEQDQRERVWFNPEQAAGLVLEQGLSILLLNFEKRLAAVSPRLQPK